MSAMALALVLSIQPSSIVAPPTDRWEWNSESTVCTLKQQASIDGQAVEIERTPANDGTEINITLPVGSKLRIGFLRDAAIKTDSGRTFVGDVAVGSNRGRRLLHLDSPDPALIDSLPLTASLQISHSKIGRFQIPVRIAAAIVTLLRDCEDKMMRGWGIDPIAWRGLQSRPMPLNRPKDRFSDLDYPGGALMANVEADVITRLDVGINGTVSSCKALNVGLFAGFGTTTCKVLRGAKFRPAADENGNLVSAPFVYNVKFRIGR